jgi:hypothetical protein
MSTAIETEPALRVEGLDAEQAARLITRVEELRRLLHDQHRVLLELLAGRCCDDAR